ncbi:MAG: cytochrome c oxidase assembly factor Coa1 family protein [Planctomycetota bacterium]
MSQYDPTFAPPQKKSCLARFWWLLLLLIVLPIASCIGLVAFTANQVVRKPAQALLDFVDSDERVKDALGSPIQYTMPISMKDMNYSNGEGQTDLTFTIEGPNGTARVKGRVNAVGGVWTGEYATVTFEDKTKITVPEGADVPEEEGTDIVIELGR